MKDLESFGNGFVRTLMAIWMVCVTVAVWPVYFPPEPDENSPECKIIELRGELKLKIHEVNLKLATLEGRTEGMMMEDKSLSKRIDYLMEK